MFYIIIRKCMDEPYCASEQTITNYFAGTYLDLMQNQVRFDFRDFGHDSIIRESKSTWTTVQTQGQVVTPFKITRTELQL